MDNFVVNEGKQEIVGSDKKYYCYAIQTRTVKQGDSLDEIVTTYAKPGLQPNDVLFISEKMVACAQGRALELDKIKVGFWAKTLSKFVVPTVHGVGLSSPATMQCAIDETGLIRIIVAAGAGAVGKLFRQKGWFYVVAGRKAAAVDPPWEHTLPPYNNYVVLAPENPKKVVDQLSKTLGGNLVMIIDQNDLGGEILANSGGAIDHDFYLQMLKQNPLGQSKQSTPMGILRPVE